jgi:hypothetical protein
MEERNLLETTKNVYFIQRKTFKENNLIGSLNNQEFFTILSTRIRTKNPKGTLPGK